MPGSSVAREGAGRWHRTLEHGGSCRTERWHRLGIPLFSYPTPQIFSAAFFTVWRGPTCSPQAPPLATPDLESGRRYVLQKYGVAGEVVDGSGEGAVVVVRATFFFVIVSVTNRSRIPLRIKSVRPSLFGSDTTRGEKGARHVNVSIF